MITLYGFGRIFPEGRGETKDLWERPYYERCHARPAWERTLASYAQRIGVSIDAIR